MLSVRKVQLLLVYFVALDAVDVMSLHGNTWSFQQTGKIKYILPIKLSHNHSNMREMMQLDNRELRHKTCEGLSTKYHSVIFLLHSFKVYDMNITCVNEMPS